MKKCIAVIAILGCFYVTGCADATNSNSGIFAGTCTPTKPTYEYEDCMKEFFESPSKYKPPESEVLTIKESMSFVEIVELIGKPHGYGTVGAATFRWDTQEGSTYNIQFFLNDDYDRDNDGLDVVNYYKYGIAISNPFKYEDLFPPGWDNQPPPN